MTTYTWKLKKSDDWQVEDDEYVLLVDGKEDKTVSVQVCLYAGGYGVNSYDYDADGRMISMTDHGVCKTTAKAFDKAIKIYAKIKGGL